MKKYYTNAPKMYQRGYDNTIRFAYIPDFKTDKEKSDFERGLKDGYAKRKLRKKKGAYEHFRERMAYGPNGPTGHGDICHSDADCGL